MILCISYKISLGLIQALYLNVHSDSVLHQVSDVWKEFQEATETKAVEAKELG